MKANEFVKEFGLDYAKHLTVKIDASGTFYLNDEREVLISDLKRLVEAHDLVDGWGGVEKTKERIEWAIVNKNFYAADMMKHNVRMVESCQ